MRAFYLAWTEEAAILQRPVGESDGENLSQAVREIPWGHNIEPLFKLKDSLQGGTGPPARARAEKEKG